MNHGLLGQKGITATTDAVDLLSLSRNLAMRGVGGERCSPDGNSSGVGGFCHSSLISSSNGKASGSLMRFGKYFFRFWWVSLGSSQFIASLTDFTKGSISEKSKPADVSSSSLSDGESCSLDVLGGAGEALQAVNFVSGVETPMDSLVTASFPLVASSKHLRQASLSGRAIAPHIQQEFLAGQG